MSLDSMRARFTAPETPTQWAERLRVESANNGAFSDRDKAIIDDALMVLLLRLVLPQ